MQESDLYHRSKPFLEYLSSWQAELPVIPLSEAIRDPKRTAILSVDVINGFCYEGALSSPRVKAIIGPIVKLFKAAWADGVRHIVLAQDTHEPEAVEFGQYPPHCVRGTPESEAVPEFKALSFFNQMTVLEKNSIHSALNTGLSQWIEAHPEVDTYLVVGDCTDLCTYQLAMHLRLDANARQLKRRVILPADCVDTYDMTVETAKSISAMPHEGELLHAIFLYHMALNGVEVVAGIR
jgi:nicotinamidase-related amidase